MQFQAKLLRQAGIRRPDSELSRAPWVLVQVVVQRTRGGKRLSMYRLQDNLLVNPPPAKELFKYSIEDLDGDTMTVFGMERCLGQAGEVAAVAQEWRLKLVSLGPGGLAGARERNIFDDVALL